MNNEMKIKLRYLGRGRTRKLKPVWLKRKWRFLLGFHVRNENIKQISIPPFFWFFQISINIWFWKFFITINNHNHKSRLSKFDNIHLDIWHLPPKTCLHKPAKVFEVFDSRVENSKWKIHFYDSFMESESIPSRPIQLNER